MASYNSTLPSLPKSEHFIKGLGYIHLQKSGNNTNMSTSISQGKI